MLTFRSNAAGWVYVAVVVAVVLTAATAGMWYTFSRSPDEPDQPAARPTQPAPDVTDAPPSPIDVEIRLRRNPIDDLEYAWIPPGTFEMGCVVHDRDCAQDERPVHRVEIAAGFWLTRTEITAAAYARYVAASGRFMPPPPEFNTDWRLGDHPVVNLHWKHARGYCAWVGGRLPSEAEWEYAARGGLRGRLFPWGDDGELGKANTRGVDARDRWTNTSPVGSFEANGFGLVDMAGNAWEWVEDEWHSDYTGAPSDGTAWGAPVETNPVETAAILRGGSWATNPRSTRCSFRSRWFWPGDRLDDYGFRCVVPELVSCEP